MGYLFSLADVAGPVVAALPTAYFLLIAAIALTAVYSSRPSRRRAAVTVLRLLLPRRMPPASLDSKSALDDPGDPPERPPRRPSRQAR